MKALLGFILTFGVLILIFGTFQWIMAKFFGIHFYGKFQAGKALQERHRYEIAIEEYSRKNPSILNEAIANCNKKGYTKTHYNILAEIKKIERENNGHPKLGTKISQGIRNAQELLKSDNSVTEIEKLKKLNELRKEGGLSESEYNSIKEKVINKEFKNNKIINPENEKIPVNESYDISNILKEQEINKAMQTINSLYFEFKNDIDILKNMDLPAVHELIFKNGNTISVINSYENLFKLYSNGLIDKEEFTIKKKQIISKSLNI